MITEAEIEKRIERSKLRLVQKQQAGLWGSEIIYYTLEKRD